MRFPSVFVSHGAPTLAIEDVPASRFLRGFGQELGRPSAILVVSAHWDTAAPMVTTAPRLETIHDLGGFDPALYAILVYDFLTWLQETLATSMLPRG